MDLNDPTAAARARAQRLHPSALTPPTEPPLAAFACADCLGPVQADACTWCGRPYPPQDQP